MVLTRASSEWINLIEPAVMAVGYELLGCELVTEGRRLVLRAYVDGAQGIDLSACEAISRQVNAILQVEKPSDNICLEVSSPGWDRPLFKVEHYQKVLNQTVKLKLKRMIAGRRRITGKLVSVLNNVLQLQCGEELVEVRYSDVDLGRLVPDK